MACVVVNGVAYVGQASDPSSWNEVAAEPTIGVFGFPAHGVVVLYDRWNVYGHTSTGQAWVARDLAIDAFRVSHTTDDGLIIEVERDIDDIEWLLIAAKDGVVSSIDEGAVGRGLVVPKASSYKPIIVDGKAC